MKRGSAVLAMTAFLAGLALFISASGVAASPTIVDTVPLPAGSGPVAVAVDSLAGMVYVADNLSDKVNVINSETNTVCNTVTVGNAPLSVCVSPLYDDVFVTNSEANTVSRIDTSINAVTATIPVGAGPGGIDVNVSTNTVYVANFGSDNVSVINGNTGTVVDTVTVGNEPRGVGVNPMTNMVYVTNYTSNTVSVIDGATSTVTDTVEVGSDPHGVSVDFVSNTVYVADHADDDVLVIDGATNTVTDAIAVGSDPWGVYANPVTHRVYVTNNTGNDVTIIDGTTNEVLGGMWVGSSPTGLAADLRTATVYVANYTSNSVTVMYDPVTWYLAEGCTGGDFETWVLVQNPGPGEATVDLTFMTSAGEVPGPRDVVIEAGTRRSFNLNAYVTDWDVSTRVESTGGVICERAMYGDGRAWAHDSIGVTRPDGIWYLAEGCTAGGFETWVLVQNTNSDTVYVSLEFMTSTGGVLGPQLFAIPGSSRHSFRVNDYVTDWDVSTMVLANGHVVCERSVYGGGREWAHDSVGATARAADPRVTDITVVGTPQGIGVNQASNRVYVSNYYDDSVSVIDGLAGRVTSTIPVGSHPRGIAVNQLRNRAYVANYSGSSVSVISGISGTVAATIDVDGYPEALGFNPATNRLYVTHSSGIVVSVINTNNDTDTGIDILVGNTPVGVAVNYLTNKIYVANLGDDTVSVIDGATNTVTDTIPVGDFPLGIAVNPATNRVYVANSGHDTVSVIDGATDAVIDTIPAGDSPGGISVDPDSNVIYTADYYDNTVTVIDGATGEEVKAIAVGDGPAVIGANPATGMVYAGNLNDDTVSEISIPTTWYLAEGCTGGDFETWVLVQNPNFGPVTVDLTFMTSAGEVPGPRDFRIPARSRHSFKVSDYVTDWDVSTRVDATGTVICERAMYGGGRTWAHDSVGVLRPGTTWYLAEGCTGEGFETWVLVQNPGEYYVQVDLTFMTSIGEVTGPQDQVIPAGSRRSFKVNDYVTDWDVSTRVEATRDVVCERAVYGGGGAWAHGSVGYAP